MTSYAILFTMAAIGVSETIYLIHTRIENEKPICPIGGGCDLVLKSKYNNIFGVYNDLLGLLFYLSALFLTGFLVIFEQTVGGLVGMVDISTFVFRILLISIAGGTLMSLILIFIQWKVIKTWCFWCLMSACTIFVMAITITIQFMKLVDDL
ncbi:MAG: vitamin K epoxide reductase family protein [Candidatus Uhrbacteria bacterium]|nr:vitamin K epoxide reductase family protein [Candidatus Uhrbacteria bacterium]